MIFYSSRKLKSKQINELLEQFLERSILITKINSRVSDIARRYNLREVGGDWHIDKTDAWLADLANNCNLPLEVLCKVSTAPGRPQSSHQRGKL